MFLAMTLAGPLLFSFSPATEAFLRTTPIGLAKVTTEKGKELQWVLQIGGTIGPENRAAGAFSIPLYLLLLAMIGGVVNMFLQLPRCLEAYYRISRETDIEKQEELVATFRAAVCEYFVYILAAPFLGIVLYGLMAAADYTNVWILGVMACSVGFMSSRIVEVLVSFSAQILDRLRGSSVDAKGHVNGREVGEGDGTR
jgi:hypothetical protein